MREVEVEVGCGACVVSARWGCERGVGLRGIGIAGGGHEHVGEVDGVETDGLLGVRREGGSGRVGGRKAHGLEETGEGTVSGGEGRGGRRSSPRAVEG